MAVDGISGKSVACLLLYCMGRLDFAVDANVLRVMTREAVSSSPRPFGPTGSNGVDCLTQYQLRWLSSPPPKGAGRLSNP